MTDTVIKGTGNSRTLKSVSNFLTSYPDYNSFAKALINGTLPVDVSGLVSTGVTTTGTALTKANLLADATATKLGLTSTATVNDAFDRIGTRLNSTYVLIGSGSYATTGGTAIGANAIAGGTNSIAIGVNANASGLNSAALMRSANASGTNSIALGYSANASGTNSIALGYSANASGDYSIAIGRYSAAGGSSVALGFNSTTSGESSVAIGYFSNTGGDTSVTLGYNTKASGNNSTALGRGANASGNNSTALGCSAVNPNDNSIQLGNASTLSKLYCAVGLTTGSDARDKTDITNIDNATEFLRKIKAIRYLRNHRELYIDNDENLSERDRENKEKYGMCTYDKEAHAKGTKKGARMRVGVLAQDLQAAMKEVYGDDSYANLVDDNLHDFEPGTVPEDVESRLSVNYEGLIPFLIKSVQELSDRLDKLEGKR